MHPLRALRDRGNVTAAEMTALLADDVEFHTPILTKVVTGRELIGAIWALSSHVRNGRYVREHKLDERTTFLQWRGEIEGRELEIFELVEDDDSGMIRKRTAAYRPLPAVELFRSAMYPSIKDWLGPEYFNYAAADDQARQDG
ncbi:hypothetical protein A5714_14050 [Mycobacterium sp. E2462]|uniref:hypothetical protein n=1 Tax=unclassified Mycobacterium TaxID=2642494 RepID=UPI0007FDDAB2|nr:MULTISPECIES: hypothetical protein [unclassified Mycobacterium]OBG72334.1 hypothetical protein A5700_09720 [Mycobacterium sp. E1214]OBH26092.1 hypothetical protein A5693_04310 [Mycobacterium sp. E1319]OBI14286.1 hypothetical protein A5714_14050 [Mycobacterium sp. E2462]